MKCHQLNVIKYIVNTRRVIILIPRTVIMIESFPFEKQKTINHLTVVIMSFPIRDKKNNFTADNKETINTL